MNFKASPGLDQRTLKGRSLFAIGKLMGKGMNPFWNDHPFAHLTAFWQIFPRRSDLWYQTVLIWILKITVNGQIVSNG